ncbi:hypothetical protein [Paenibacillus herberti]|uniref:Uncharacterized protein n=1 Tax=Paenibacillus herberti TaxID=1619309 RepID=A0A229P359_9BACL|nr:hypothetical protein [Paenibacillus herberti]OXM16550.1 hypothetical protein CGZ75_07745 [Paenibacillus herberti]
MTCRRFFTFILIIFLLLNIILVTEKVKNNTKTTVKEMVISYEPMMGRIAFARNNISLALQENQNSELLLHQASAYLDDSYMDYLSLIKFLQRKDIPYESFHPLLNNAKLFSYVVLADKLSGNDLDKKRLGEINEDLTLILDTLPKQLKKDQEITQLRQAFEELKSRYLQRILFMSRLRAYPK